MRLRVLGTAAGGGVPQWNCGCPGCAAARARPGLRRRHASLAVRTDGELWYVVNAAPDITDQIEAAPELRPGPGRATPVAGAILTDGELDHVLGLLRLREADGLRILATRTVREALGTGLRLDGVLGAYADLRWAELPREGSVALDDHGTVAVRAIPVSAKRPRYAADLTAADTSWSVALEITDQATGGSAVYAPALADWPPALDAAVRRAGRVLLDGTFWDDQEPVRTGISGRTARQMGHLPISGPDGTAERLVRLGVAARCRYTHLNNTNPLVDPAAPQARELAGLGLRVAEEDMVIDL